MAWILPVALLLAALGLRPDEADELVQRLRSGNVEERAAAAERLKELGAAARPVLEKAAKDADAEVAGRARTLLDLLRLKERLGPRLGSLLAGREEAMLLQDA